MRRMVAALLVCLLTLLPAALAEEGWGDFAQYETPFEFTVDDFQASCIYYTDDGSEQWRSTGEIRIRL